MKFNRLSIFLVLVLLVSACHGYVIHPGAPNKTASVAYDTLQTTDSVIKSLKSLDEAGKLNILNEKRLNVLITTYNHGKDSLQIYSDIITAGKDPAIALANLDADLDALTKMVAILKGVK